MLLPDNLGYFLFGMPQIFYFKGVDQTKSTMYNLFQDVHHSQQYQKFWGGDLLFAEYMCDPGELRSKLWTENHYFTFVVKGKIELTTLRGSYTLEAGKAFFVKKGSCTFQLFPEEGYCELIIFVTDELIRTTLDRHRISLRRDPTSAPTDTVVPLAKNTLLETYYQSLLSYFSQVKPPSQALLQLKFEELLLNLLEQEDNPLLHQGLWDIQQTGKVSISQIMEQNYCSDLSLSDFACLCARSLSSFRRDFLQVYGMPPGQWLREKRLERSKQLLNNTQMKMEEISFECGFRNRSHFSRLFKQRVGISPQSYRSGASIRS